MALKEMFVVSAPGCKAGYTVRHESRVTAEQDMRHLQDEGFTPKLVTILVPINPPSIVWG